MNKITSNYSNKKTLGNIANKLKEGYSFTLSEDRKWMGETFAKGGIVSINNVYLKDKENKTNLVTFSFKNGEEKGEIELSGKIFLGLFINDIPEKDIVYKERENVKGKVEKITKK